MLDSEQCSYHDLDLRSWLYMTSCSNDISVAVMTSRRWICNILSWWHWLFSSAILNTKNSNRTMPYHNLAYTGRGIMEQVRNKAQSLTLKYCVANERTYYSSGLPWKSWKWWEVRQSRIDYKKTDCTTLEMHFYGVLYIDFFDHIRTKLLYEMLMSSYVHLIRSRVDLSSAIHKIVQRRSGEISSVGDTT